MKTLTQAVSVVLFTAGVLWGVPPAQGESPSAAFIVPSTPVTRKTYVDYVKQQLDPESLVGGPNRGQYGPRHALPALAVYAYGGERRYGEAIKKAIKFYDAWVQSEVEKHGGRGFYGSWEGPYLCGFHVRELRKRGMLTQEDEKWLKEMFIRLADNMSCWAPGDGLWRGSQHRAQGQAIARGLAAMWYPDCPKAREWEKYFETVWNDWWQYRDVGINDINYFFGSFCRILCAAELMGKDEVFTDPKVKEFIWDRVLYEVTPEGMVPPYGAHLGWNSHAGHRIFALELAAAHTGDGRYRWVAHRLMNYLMARGQNLHNHHHVHALNVEAIALASLVCDDSVKPVEPDPACRVLYRKEVLRLTEKEVRSKYPGYAGLDCNMDMSQRVMPHKVVFRSGWEPGDLYMLVETFPRHDPLNPTAVLTLVDHGSAMAMMEYEKFISRENTVRIEDLSNEATYLGNPNHSGPKRLPTGYAGMEVDVRDFSDHKLASHATVHVTNYMGYEAEHEREIFFIKNRFVVMRDETTFDDTFRARVGPVWNTQKVDPRGENWINTYITGFYFQGTHLYDNPRWDLLVYHFPKRDRKLDVARREDAENVGLSTRYVWEGNVRPGFELQFGQLLLPHAPQLSAAALAAGIEVLRDEPGLIVLRVRTEDSRKEWIVLNPEGREVELPPHADALTGLATDARLLYLDGRRGKVARALAVQGTYLRVDGTELFREGSRTTFEKTE